MLVVIGIVYLLLIVVAFMTLIAGLDKGNRRITTVGVILVAIWGAWAIVH